MPIQYTVIVFQHYHHEKSRKTITADTDESASIAAVGMLHDDERVELFRTPASNPIFILDGREYRAY